MSTDQPGPLRKIQALIRARRLPWRLRIFICFLKGLMLRPRLAIRLAPTLSAEGITVYRFNLHMQGRSMLKVFYEESDRLGMRPFLLWGTLLGAVRDGDFIIGDNDVDLGMRDSDFARRHELIVAMKSRGYPLRSNGPNQFSLETRDGLLNLDVDLLTVRDGALTCAETFTDGTRSYYSFPKEPFDSLAQVEFLGIRVWIPSDADRVLTSVYGDWRIPVANYDSKKDPRNKVAQ